MKIKNLIAVTIAIIIFVLIAFAIFWHNKEPIPVVIQAGHEGRSSGNTGAYANGISELKWNIFVANEVAKQLKQWDIKYKRVGAKPTLLKAKIAVAIHFDGAKKSCSSGASVGYKNKESKEFANRWKKIYSKYYPFNWQKDNFTKNLSDYYGYYYIDAKKFLVLELGEISCAKEAKWLKAHLKKIAKMIAYTIARELGYMPRRPF